MSASTPLLEAAWLRPVADEVCVAGQLTPEAMAEAVAAGFRSVVNNRPDGEEGPEQPLNADIEAAALKLGLAYRYLPVNPAYQSREDAEAFAELLATLPRPILAFCRSGARSTRLFAAAQAV
jgi:uncharacterized protein (TIGR01244 family)